ncbi:MAG: filamentous hemagglutinin N-terminal domain-containing protein [Paraburkholderia sp.]|nr:MAG: filamentous hemagglutinin N-terminal domain-containing protein [Paraburkholderia sp.]
MNSGIFRLVFSAARCMLIPVGECASACRSEKRSRIRRSHRCSPEHCSASLWLAVRASAFAALCALVTKASEVHAQATLPISPDRSTSNHPVVGVSASGLPLINIVAPNQAGVSLNNFTQYNVGTKGAVVVNTPRSVQTQIAGWVQGNPLVGNSPARLIINQVTSGNPTRLLGMTEIAGNRANLIIANPAGITCAGCGFINVPRISLTTGRPNFNADGSLASFEVRKGWVGIDGGGLDARGSAIDLIARAMRINAQVWAGSIHATTGANQVDYATGAAEAVAGEDEKPGVAIDVQTLGGMYANSVRLIGTEAGVGVRHTGAIDSLTGDIELSSAGDVTIEPAGRIQAAADVSIVARNVTNRGASVSGGAARLMAAGTLRNDGVISASFNADLGATDLRNSGYVLAGIDGSNRLAAAGSVTLAGEKVSSDGTIAAGDNINVTGLTVSFEGGKLFAASALNLAGEQMLTGRGATASALNATLRSNGAFVNDVGQFVAADEVRVAVRSASNRGGVVGGDAVTLTAHDIDNGGGTLAAGSYMAIHAAGLSNDGGFIGAEEGTLRARDASTATGSTSDEAAATDLLGRLSIDLAGDLSNRHGVIVAGERRDLTARSLASNTSERIVSATGIDNTDGIADGEVKLKAAGIINADGVIFGSNVGIDSRTGQIDNVRGVIGANGRIESSSGEIDNRSGLIQAGELARLRTNGGTFDNRIAQGEAIGGRLISQKVTLETGLLNNADGLISSSEMSRLTAQAVSNDKGAILSTGALDVKSVGQISNIAGQIGADADVVLEGSSIDNTRGAVHAGQNLDVKSNVVVNAQTKDATLAPVFDLPPLQAGMEGAAVSLNAGVNVDNTGGSIRSDLTTGLIGRTVANVDGVIGSSGRVSVQAEHTVTNTRGAINGGDSLTLSAETLNNDGRIESRGDVTVAVRGDLTNSGAIVAGGDLDATAQGNVTNTAKMTANKVAKVSGQRIDNAASGEITGNVDTRVDAVQSLSNKGLIDGGATRVKAAGTVSNKGRIYGDSVSVGASLLRNEANAEGFGAAIASRGDLDLGAKVIENRGGSLVYASNDIRTGGGIDEYDRASDARSVRFTNDGSSVDAGGRLKIAADRFENLNANFRTEKVTTDSGKQIWHTVPGSTERVHPSDVYFYQQNSQAIAPGTDYRWALDDDQKRLLLPSAKYPFAEYARYTQNGTAGKIDDVRYATVRQMSDTGINVLRDEDLAGVFRTVPEEVWTKFGVTPPPPPPSPGYIKPGQYSIQMWPLRRQLGADWHSLNVPMAAVPDANSTGGPREESCVTSAADHCRPFKDWYGRLSDSYTALARALNAYNRDVSNRMVQTWTTYDVDVKSTKDVVTATQPGVITAGGRITISAHSGVNDKSQILAGGRAYLNDAIQDNSQPKGVETFAGTGKAITTWVESGGAFRGDERKHAERDYIAPLPPREFDLPIAMATQANREPIKRVAADVAVTGGASGIRAGSAVVALSPGTAELIDVGQRLGVAGSNGIPMNDRGQTAPRPHAKPLAIEIRAVEPNIVLPSNALYRVVSDPGSRYLVESDPRFTNRKHWLSSETMITALGADPRLAQKRMADGFYEQQLIQRQVMQATGRRFIGNYTDNQTAYQALMANGVKAARRFELNVGTALSDAQMAALTEDIVWLVNRTVALPDGSREAVLVPQLYLRTNAADVNGMGSIIAGENVVLNNTGVLENSGTIASRGVTILTAGSIANSGAISGAAVRADAKQDLTNLGGTIQGEVVRLSAGRDVKLTSTTQSAATMNGSATAIDRVARVDAGTLAVEAGRDLEMSAAHIASTGDGWLVARRDVNIAAIRQHRDDHVRWGEKRRTDRDASIDIGAEITAGGELGIVAGRDLNATAATLSAESDLRVIAGRDVTFNAGHQTASAYDEHYVNERGVLSSKSTHTIDASGYAEAIGSTLSGNTVEVRAGNDLTASAVTIAGTEDVWLEAGNALKISTADTAFSERHFRDVKKSGLGSAGAGISYGVSQTTDTSFDTVKGVRGSLIGSIDGSVTLRAHNTLSVTGSDIIAARDITGVAKEVRVEGSQTNRRYEESHEMKSSGFALGVKSPVIDALQNLNQQARGAGTSQDGRAAALHAIAAAGGVAGLAGAAGSAASAISGGAKPEAKLELSFGASRSKSTFALDNTQQTGSNVRAGGKAVFVATGEKGAGQGNVTIEGSDVAANDVLLVAANKVNLFHSSDTESTRSTNESSSASVGVSFGTNGWGMSAAMSRAVGKANSDAVMRNNTHIVAGNVATIASGGDTNIIGANVSAKRMIADIGGDLNIASVQDTLHSVAEQRSMGGGFSVSQGGGSASFSMQSGRASGDYASVNEQSGIQAGDGGFDIAVKGNTDLKGAYIASSAVADKNRLTTGTLSFSNILNSSHHKANTVGVTAGGSSGNGGNNYATHGATAGRNAGGASPMYVSEGASSQASTSSGISAGDITIVDGTNQRQDIAMLNRNAMNSNGAVAKVPDISSVLGNQSDLIDAAQAASETLAKQIGAYANAKQSSAQAAAARETDPALRMQYLQEAAAWSEGGNSRVALHMAGGALAGGLTGGGSGAMGGAAGAGLSAKLAPQLNEIARSIAEAGPTGNDDFDQLVGNIASNLIAGGAGALAGGATGAVTSTAADRFNRQLGDEEKKAIKKGAGDDKELEQRLTRAACYEVKCWAQYKPGSAEYTANYVSQLEASQLQAEFDWVKDQKQTGLFGYTPVQKVGDAIQSDPVGVAKDLVKVGAGLAAAKVGGVLCASAAGCGVGASMFVFGTSDAIEGSTSLHDRYYGVSSRGVNPLRWGFNQISPTWGDLAYDGISFGTALAGLKMPVPLNVGKADGLNRPTSMFGVSVQNINNVKLYPITKGAMPTGTHQSTLLFGVGSKGLAVVEDIRELGRPE